MNKTTKNEIVLAAKQYMEDKGLSQNDMAKASKVNGAYLGPMLRGEECTQVGDKMILIADKWFIALAECIGFEIKKQDWPVQATPQFLKMMDLLEDAKLNPQAMMIIGDTGSGKTFSVDRFCHQNPANTIRVTVADHYKLNDILNEICDQAGIPTKGSNITKIFRLQAKLTQLRRSGAQPIVIIDEAENLKYTVLRMIKGMYDNIIPYASLVLIGTADIQYKIEMAAKRPGTCMPQLCRRFKAGTHYLPTIDRTFSEFLKPFAFERGLVRLLVRLADNYGELYDYVTRAQREAKRLAQPLDEHTFRLIFNLPK